MKKLWCVLILVWGLMGPCGAEMASNTIDFPTQTLSAWGIAGTPWESSLSLEEERARAWMDAIHHAYETALEVPVMEGVTVKTALLANPALKERLGQLLLSAKKEYFQVDVSGLIRCKVMVPFCGPMSLRSAFYLAALRPAMIEPGSGNRVASGSKNASGPEEVGLIASAPAVERMIIDVRRSNFEPSLFPRFFSEEGRLLFQEGTVPGPKRFSRPVVRFSRQIEEAESGLLSSEVMYVAAFVPPLSRRDIKILAPDADMFYRFCRALEEQPESQREVLIVYGPVNMLGGLLPKAAAKDKEKEKTSKPPAGSQKDQKRSR